MITNKELNEVSLSPTKKDYYQIWNEIVDLAAKISDRWSPESTNESDPGIVLLKALVAIADKLNYNIDKNTLEAFMPSATQQESMRKLTEMMGYSMQYYKAATCEVTIKLNNTTDKSLEQFVDGIYFPKYVNLKNEEEDINFVTLEDFRLQKSEPIRKVSCIEGELIECETNTDNIISMVHLDDNNRYLLPETNVAENGIIVCNVSDDDNALGESAAWRQVDNLNIWLPGEKIWKFGFDSKENLPYIQFPEDISQLIEDGLRIKYIRTNGLMGNISKNTLSKLEVPALWSSADDENISDLTSDDFIVTNSSAATNGADPESLNAAYNNFKKTVGTFDTLVTCRDYMNKIYQLTMSATDTTPLVSNIIVSDIRDDINRAATLCSFNDYGICYIDMSLPTDSSGAIDQIEHFDLVLYPFKTIYGLNDKNEYINSFKYNAENFNKIDYDIAKQKTIAHNFTLPSNEEIVCIKNYIKLKADITTIKKVTLAEEAEILAKIYKAIYENFNCRKIDFGEKIPDETIKEVIKNSDPRIKDVDYSTPTLFTKIMTGDNSEYELVATDDDGHKATFELADRLYNKLVLKNILAGKIAAFQYDNDFATDYTETLYEINGVSRLPVSGNYINKLTTEFKVGGRDYPNGLVLGPNEVVQFRMPNLRTVKTFPCYVNYYLHLNTNNIAEKNSIPATLQTLDTYMAANNNAHWNALANGLAKARVVEATENDTDISILGYGKFFVKTVGNNETFTYSVADEKPAENAYKLVLDENTFGIFYNYLKGLVGGIYRSLGADIKKPAGYLVDSGSIKYLAAYSFSNANKPLQNYYVPVLHDANSEEVLAKQATTDGLGKDAEFIGISKDSEYQLKDGEYLLFNWTDSQKDSSGNETKTVMNQTYSKGTIIKPNFDLTDSELYKNNHSFSKKTGFSFPEVKNLEGLFTLGANEQICIRDIVKIDLDSDGTYLYWIRNDENPDELKHVFTFDEYYPDSAYADIQNYTGGVKNPRYVEGGSEPEWLPNAYVLKEGEQLYYTDSKKLDLAFYGTGSLIVKHQDTPTLIKDTQEGTVSAEDIITYGLNAIPWGSPYRLILKNNTTNSSKKIDARISVIENQYINLTEGDTLLALTSRPNEKTIGTGQESYIGLNLSNNWQSTGAAKYKFAEQDGIQNLPTVDIEGLGWYVRSRLDLNMSPESAQVLTGYYDNNVYYGDIINVYSKNTNGIQSVNELIPNDNHDGDETKVAVYSNYGCQLASDHIELMKEINFKIKLSSVDSIAIDNGDSTGVQLELDNYVSGESKYTKVSFGNFSNIDVEDPVFTLNVNIPSDDLFGLIMFYYIDEELGGTHTPAYITSTGGNIKLFNTDATAADTYEFVSGIQVLQIDSTATSLTVYADSSVKSNLIFGKLSLVKDINKKLNYRYDSNDGSDTPALNQLLADIKNLGPNINEYFYFNIDIDNSNAIDLNASLETDLLSSPETWYDPNNVNNKFVISEISADDLSKGITLTRASKAAKV